MFLLVVTAHALVISALWRTSTSMPSARNEASRPSVLMWLLSDRQPLPTRAPSTRSSMKEPAPTSPRRPAAADNSIPLSEEASLAGESAESAHTQDAMGTSEPSGSVSPLRLKPSQAALHGAFVHPATTDPRSNSPRATADERLAMAFDATLCVLEERLPDGTVRRAYGRRVDAAPSIQREQGVPGKKISVCRP